MSTKNKPLHTVRFGLVEAAIWENTLEDGKKVHNVTVGRLYKPENSETWKSTSSLRRSDLPLAAKALDEAHTFLYREIG